MDADDTFEEFQRVATTGAAALSRAAEVLIRSGQDTKARHAAETARVTEDLQRRAEAQSQAADRYYARATEPGWVRSAGPEEVAVAWKGVHQWSQIDPERFERRAEALNDQIRAEYGFDPREGAGGLEEQAQGCRDWIAADRGPNPGGAGEVDAGALAEARQAREKADYLTGYDPHTITETTHHRRGAPAASTTRTPMRGARREQERERGR